MAHGYTLTSVFTLCFICLFKIKTKGQTCPKRTVLKTRYKLRQINTKTDDLKTENY